MLVSAAQQCELAIIIYLSPPLWPPSPPLIPPSRLSQSYRLGFLRYTETSHQLCILRMMVYIWWCCFLHCPRSLFPLLCSQVCSLCWCLHSFEAGSPKISIQFSSVSQSCPTLCDPMDCSTPGFPVCFQLQMAWSWSAEIHEKSGQNIRLSFRELRSLFHENAQEMKDGQDILFI